LYLEEDPQVNRFEESLNLWKEVTGSLWLKNQSFILFLNRSDLFKEKIKVRPLSQYFKDYTGTFLSRISISDFFEHSNKTLIYREGEDNDYEAGVKFLQKKYDDAFKGTLLYRYVTCAVDRDNIQKVFESVKNTILIRKLEHLGMKV
jgi:hypothetical protein